MLIFTFLSDGIDTYAVSIFKSLIDFFKQGTPMTENEWHLVAYFLVYKAFAKVFRRHAYFIRWITLYRSSVELNCLIFSKVLKDSQVKDKNDVQEGEILNLSQIDSMRVGYAMMEVSNVIAYPILIGYNIYCLFEIDTYSSVVFLILVIFFVFLNFWLSYNYGKLNLQLLEKRDERMKISSETFSDLKTIKLFGWDGEFLKRIIAARLEELQVYFKIIVNRTVSRFFIWNGPPIETVAFIGTYYYYSDVFSMQQILTCMLYITKTQDPIRNLPMTLNNLMESFISVKRIQHFLNGDDLVLYVKNQENGELDIEIRDASFSYTKDNALRKNSHFSVIKEQPAVLSNINFKVKKGELVGVIGDIGSGKTSLLEAILNSLLLVNDGSVVVSSSISYVSQKPWLIKETIRNNIIMDNPYDEALYKQVLKVCSLEEDLRGLPNNDLTYLSEKGANLSGGQRSRVAIARAVYSQSDILLLDCPLAALDAKVTKKIMNECMLKYLKGKTRVFVTHNDSLLQHMDRVVFLDGGCIKWEGTPEELLKHPFFHSSKPVKKATKEEEHEEEQTGILLFLLN